MAGRVTAEQDRLDPGEGPEPRGDPVSRDSWRGEKGLGSGSEALLSAEW